MACIHYHDLCVGIFLLRNVMPRLCDLAGVKTCYHSQNFFFFPLTYISRIRAEELLGPMAQVNDARFRYSYRSLKALIDMLLHMFERHGYLGPGSMI